MHRKANIVVPQRLRRGVVFMLLELDAAKATTFVRPLLDGVAYKEKVREKLEGFAATEGLQL